MSDACIICSDYPDRGCLFLLLLLKILLLYNKISLLLLLLQLLFIQVRSYGIACTCFHFIVMLRDLQTIQYYNRFIYILMDFLKIKLNDFIHFNFLSIKNTLSKKNYKLSVLDIQYYNRYIYIWFFFLNEIEWFHSFQFYVHQIHFIKKKYLTFSAGFRKVFLHVWTNKKDI